ncbi:MAG TPA: glycosyltransferase [Ilumatobacteraceae bacterium]|nr:glycosyltransferase [Ilumatobacteraceae bacterium]
MSMAEGRPPLVSCVMIFLNGARFLDEAIASVIGQKNFVSWELILVDDGSTDDSTEIARGLAASDPQRIKYVEHPGHANLGMSAARNLGVSMASGTYIGFLDSDDIWLPSLLAQRMKVALANPDADVIVGGTWRWYSWTGNPGDLAADHRMDLPAATTLTTLEPPALFAAIYGTPGAWHVPAMCSLLIRRESFLAVGGSAPEFRDLHEDQVLYTKVSLGLRAVIDPRPLSLYRQHPDSMCARSVADGTWNPNAPSAPEAGFLTWMEEHVRSGAFGEDVKAVVRRNVERHVSWPEAPARRERNLRAVALRHAPTPVLRLARSIRHRRAARRAPGTSVIGEWVGQVLSVAMLPATGDVLVATPSPTHENAFVGALSPACFPSAANVVVCGLEDHVASVRYAWVVVVGAGSGGERAGSDPLAFVERHLRPDGTAIVFAAGRDLVSPLGRAESCLSSSEMEEHCRQRFAGSEVSVETFGNPATAAAVAAGIPALEVPGVLIDHHDGRTEVMLALTISPCCTPSLGYGSSADG